MLQTDSASIATQHQWANEFLNSAVGQSAIGSQVHEALASTKGDVKKAYMTDANTIAQSNDPQTRYRHDSEVVEHQTSTAGLIKLDAKEIGLAEDLQARHRLNSVSDKSARIDDYVKNKIQTTEIKNKEK